MKLVLIAEDEYGQAEILRLLLETSGYRVAVATDGRAALELLNGEKPAVIVSDFMMPRMNGAELGEAVKSDVTLRDIPFIFTSGTDETAIRSLFRHYDAFVAKPYEADELLALVERFAAEGRPQKKIVPVPERPVQEFLRDLGVPPSET